MQWVCSTRKHRFGTERLRCAALLTALRAALLPIQPLDVVVVGEGEQHLIADDGEGEQQHSTQSHGQGEGAQPQPVRGSPCGWSEFKVPQGDGGECGVPSGQGGEERWEELTQSC